MSGIDIDALPAWDITTGDSNIVVAVIDDGVEVHEDFYDGQLVSGYSEGGGDGSPGSGAEHGQCVAGIIAANHNSIGVRGVAPNVKIMSVNIFSGGNLAPGDSIAGAIDTAWSRGAGVLCNSWGYPSCNGVWIEPVASAIERALTLGRDGKGCVVVFAAGDNFQGTCVTFPATINGVLAVGAVGKNNQPPCYTPRDSRIDVVAPSHESVLIDQECGGVVTDTGIVTTDRMGAAGYSSGNYISVENKQTFGGTSAAAPQVAGISALLLSVAPGLYADTVHHQVQDIIKLSAHDYGNTNWDGYGRVDAYLAVQCVTSPPPPDSLSWHWVDYGGGKKHPRFTWQRPSSCAPANYKIYRCIADYSLLTTVSGDSTAYTDTTIDWAKVPDGYAYYYLTSFNVAEGGSSDTVAVACERCYNKTAPRWSNSKLPKRTELQMNYPNPFNPSTSFSYALSEDVYVMLKVYDVLGREVAAPVSELQRAGYKSVTFNASNLPSGVYFYRLTAGKYTAVKKMLLMK